MNFAFDEAQEALRQTARRFLETQAPSPAVRAAMATPTGYDRGLWERVGAELGWPSILIPEAYGGAGLGYVELVAVLEEMGRAVYCGPFFSTVCMAANVLLTGGDVAQKQAWLTGIAEGRLTAALALTEESGRWDAAGIEAEARRDGAHFILDGRKTWVIDGHMADLLLIAARAPGSRGEEGVSVFAVPAKTPGVSRRALPTMDQTRRQAEIRLEQVRVPLEARIGGEGEGWPVLRRALDLAAVALAAEQVGGAEKCLEMAVEYAKVRVQFNRPIGSFQAIKHKCADMFVRVESARSAAYHAGWVAATSPAQLPAAASLAKAYCSDAYFHCAAESIQIHGGIGFTWEHDAHLHFKRAQSGSHLLGTSAWHRERIARQIGL